MSKRNTTLISIYVISIILLIAFLINDYQHKNAPFRCSGELSILLKNNDYDFTMNTSISIIGLGDRKGVIRIKGNIKHEDQTQSIINRAIYFTRINKDQNIFSIQVTDKEKLPTDTTDDDVFSLFSINHTNLRMASQVYNNALLFHDTMEPQFLCVKY
ncbi:FidL-like protein [Providencia burhodogranariea]|uniref:Uncharacterized protein n=1 Tax=Providencia burhodogranariea DSM 19968 TaxID=1141662 RepID=K8WVJ6_9GAMM|nr:FidL-like protein [Providencia burhodogranariea]EKT64623.1 hypothetical protein OOA_02462 [Providencia burhodogranariea DSM 19968]